MQIHKQKPNRIARQLILAVVLFSSFFTVISSAFQLYRNFDRDIQAVDTRLNEIESVNLTTLVDSVWISNRKEIIRQLEGIHNVPDIQYLEITEEGEIIVKVGEKLGQRIVDRQYPLVRTYRDQAVEIGSLYVQASLHSAYKHVFDQVWNILISNGIKTFLVSGFILYLFHYLVTRHLFRIAEFAGRFDISNINEELELDKPPLQDSKNADEIDVVVYGFKNMQQKIGEAITSLQDRENFIHLLLDSTAEAIYGIDTQGQCTFINQACLKMLGYQHASDLLGKLMHQEIHYRYLNGEPYPESECQIHQAFMQNTGTHVDNEVLWRKDGSSFPVEYWSFPTIDEGKATGAVVTFIDISERLEAQREQARLVSIIENSMDFMGITNQSGQFLFLNSAARKLLGTDNEILAGEFKLASLLSEEETSQFTHKLMDEVMQLGSWSGECSIKTHREKGPIPVLMDIVRIDDGVLDLESNLAVVIRDMSEIHAAQEEIRHHRDHLEELVEERTSELEATVKELESFSYSVSHDLRSPLRGIDGFSLALLEDYSDQLDDTGRDYLSRVRAGAQRMGSLIDDLLKLSRVTRVEMRKDRMDLAVISLKIVASLQEKYAKNHTKVDIQPDLHVNGDAGLIQIVLENLLDNAWKYSANTNMPSISLSGRMKNGKTVFCIRDNGVGFNMLYYNKLFGAFQRLHSGDEFSGTGIGLATVQRAIQRHGGQIWAEAEEGRGAAFYFTLE